MPPYTISPTIDLDLLRLSEIFRAAFANDRLVSAALGDIPTDEHDSWHAGVLATARAPSGYGVQLICARDAKDGSVVGWAKWQIPATSTTVCSEAIATRSPPPLPTNAKIELLVELDEDAGAAEESLMGDQTYWGENDCASWSA
jgi:hypothetical protein